jgi:hypothetical protein
MPTILSALPHVLVLLLLLLPTFLSAIRSRLVLGSAQSQEAKMRRQQRHTIMVQRTAMICGQREENED